MLTASGALAGVFLFPRWVAIVFDALLYNVDRGQEAQVENELNFFCTTVAAKFAATSLVWPLPCIIDALREIRKTFFVKYFTGSSNNVLGNLLFKSFVETFSQNFLTFSFELFFAKEFKIARFLVRFPRRHTLKFASYHRLLSYRFMPS